MRKIFEIKSETLRVPPIEFFDKELAQAVKDVVSGKLSYYNQKDSARINYMFSVSRYYFARKGRYPESEIKDVQKNFGNLFLELQNRNDKLKSDNYLRELCDLSAKDVVEIDKNLEERFSMVQCAFDEGRKLYSKANSAKLKISRERA